MFKTVAWGVLAIFLGMVAAFLVVLIGEMIGFAIYPPPPGLNPSDPEALAAAMKTMPIGALVVVVVAWLLAAFAGGWVATRLASKGKLICGMTFGALFLLVTFVNLRTFPHPVWMWVVGLGEILPAAFLGTKLAMPKRLTPAQAI
jgi:hypothetical protein